jgi:polysaccharide biosynthesis/export protein
MSIRLAGALCAVFFLLPSCLAFGQGSQNPDHPAGTDSAAPPANNDAPAPDPKAAQNANYVIGNDDQLGINVWKEPDFTQSVPVRSDGRITLPLIGEVQATGRTPLELEKDITAKLRDFVNNPEVTVMVLQMNSQKFNILGRVTKPGSYSLSSTTTVLDAIADAGGFQDFAKQKDIYILRQNPTGHQTRIPFNYKDVVQGTHPEQNILLLPHDTIIVP